eukprot:gnl/TRDRNA2_/TRDRNA2_88345_c0_seq1.p1 gnl/TRDRNA2_/TRDRNA2_88345_c0~~gnl/TRDRNA2_/TRDRNA2_88345_c0_seq1.p1  ORF type:complete len:297 (+),score=53.07 gnl/TRDRNA2_/TRDRNA2_88345_c0_seq1:29-892(+)
MYVAAAGSCEAISILTAAGADVNTADKQGKTALLYAVGAGCPVPECGPGAVPCLRALLEAKADPNEKSLEGVTALMTACSTGSVLAVSTLITRRADLNSHGGDDGPPALAFAAVQGHLPVVRQLLKAMAAVDARYWTGETPLMSACGGAHLEVVEELLAASADPLARTEDGGCALLFLAERGIARPAAASVANLLLGLGADPKAAAGGGTRTPLLAVASSTNAKVSEMFVAAMEARAEGKTFDGVVPETKKTSSLAAFCCSCLEGLQQLWVGAPPDMGGFLEDEIRS